MSKRFFSTWSSARAWGVAAAGMVMAIGVIVLAQARTEAGEPSPAALPPEVVMPISARGDVRDVDVFPAPELIFAHPGVSGVVALNEGAVLAHGTRRVFAELLLSADQGDGPAVRRPVALAVVLDVSGSMSGEKIEEARRAVLQLLRSMHDDDRIALVLYNDTTELLQPLARVGAVRASLTSRVGLIRAGGGTNIPQGLRLGSHALDGADGEHMRRVVLVSDGLDHSGDSLDAVTSEVRLRADRGATFSSLGVGTDYDERFLARVADAGRGNYEFLAQDGQLERFLARELEQAATTVVVGLTADLQLPLGWRVASVLGADGQRPVELSGRHAVLIPVGSMFAGEQRRVLVVLDIDAGAPGTDSAMRVSLDYHRPRSAARDHHDIGQLALKIVSDEQQVLASRNVARHADSLTTVIDARQEQAVEAWRQGRHDHAIALSSRNAHDLETINNEVFSDARANQIREYQQDTLNFQQRSASSESGRAYGLQANQARRVRIRDWISR